LGDGGADGSLALQNLVEKAALDAVTPGKSVLASFSLNCCLEQPDNVVVFQHKWGAAHFACAPGMSRFRLFTFWQCKRPGGISRNPGDTVQCGKTSLPRGVSTPCSADRVLSVLPSAPRTADFTGTARNLISPDNVGYRREFFSPALDHCQRGAMRVGGV